LLCPQLPPTAVPASLRLLQQISERTILQLYEVFEIFILLRVHLHFAVTQQLQNDTQQGAMAYLEVVRPSGHLTAGKHHHYYPTKGKKKL